MARVVLVTGAAGGIGRAIAKEFADAGWRVVGTDREEPTGPVAFRHFVTADVSSEVDWHRIVGAAVAEGELQALINNAAVQIAKPLAETEPNEWDAVMNTNLKAPYLAVRESYPHLRKTGGAVVNVGSVHAIATSSNIAAYAASKGGLLALTRALAVELAPDRIRVNAVLPGAVDTPMLDAGLAKNAPDGMSADELRAALARKTVMGRIGAPAEIARAVRFLAEDESASFITGQALVVDGGATARLSTE